MRDLHDRLSEHLERVANGIEIVVTRRGRPIARLSAVDAVDPLEELVRRGLGSPACLLDLNRAANDRGLAVAPAP